jgi:hypothetical protein
MSLYKLAAGLVALALSAAVVTALAGAGAEVKADRPADATAAVAPDAKMDVAPEGKTTAAPDVGADRAPAAAKGDRPVVRPAEPDASKLKWACPPEPWPYGCQWREPPVRKKVIRGSRPT